MGLDQTRPASAYALDGVNKPRKLSTALGVEHSGRRDSRVFHDEWLDFPASSRLIITAL